MTQPNDVPLRKRAKKAFVAGLFAAAGSAATVLIGMGNGSGVPDTGQAWVALVAGCLGVGIATGVATFNATNAGQPVGGSDPVLRRP